MSERKETPDLLSEILGGEAATPAASESPAKPSPAPAKPKTASKPRKTSTSPRRTKSQPKWEYHLVSFQDHKGWRLRFVDGEEVEDWTDGPLMHEYLDLMGESGWELTSACSGEKLFGLTDKFQLYFKRLK
jgi:hypothetical protein